MITIRHIRNYGKLSRRLMSHVYSCLCTFIGADFVFVPGCKGPGPAFLSILPFPLSTNPANTGFIPDADYRIGAHYRNQYSNIMAVPYKTMSVYADAQLFRDRIENGWLGVGGLLLSDVAGSGSLRSTKIYGSLAYHQMLGNSSLLSAGFNVGWANKRIDVSALKFPDQFDGRF